LLSNSNSRMRRGSIFMNESSDFLVASSRSRARNSARRDMVNLHRVMGLVLGGVEHKCKWRNILCDFLSALKRPTVVGLFNGDPSV